ncbi:MAG TPA: hypothetical protein VGF99_03295 [Myxococcota bacterium]
MKTLAFSTFAILAAIAGTAACDGPFSGDEGSAFETDCRQICEKYEDCVDDDTDIDDCTADCVENSVESDNFQEEVDNCEECLDGESCIESVFGCSSECGEVIDEST